MTKPQPLEMNPDHPPAWRSAQMSHLAREFAGAKKNSRAPLKSPHSEPTGPLYRGLHAMALKQKSRSAGFASRGRAGRLRVADSANRNARRATAVLADCRAAANLSRRKLLAMAVARGCWHYATLWPDIAPDGRSTLRHEFLGCALLRGPANVETFQAIRCGAMVLSDSGNSPELIALAAQELGVAGRVAHVARLGAAHDERPAFWRRMLAALPAAAPREQDFLPGLSRLVLETLVLGRGRAPQRIWLRTDYRR